MGLVIDREVTELSTPEPDTSTPHLRLRIEEIECPVEKPSNAPVALAFLLTLLGISAN